MFSERPDWNSIREQRALKLGSPVVEETNDSRLDTCLPQLSRQMNDYLLRTTRLECRYDLEYLIVAQGVTCLSDRNCRVPRRTRSHARYSCDASARDQKTEYRPGGLFVLPCQRHHPDAPYQHHDEPESAFRKAETKGDDPKREKREHEDKKTDDPCLG